MTHYMDLPFGEGEVIKNYKEMCARLGEKERSGNARKSQLKRWGEYFNWEKKGHKFVITEVTNEKYPTHDTNLLGAKAKSYSIYLQRLIINLLYETAKDRNVFHAFLTRKTIALFSKIVKQQFFHVHYGSNKKKNEIADELNELPIVIHDFFQRVDRTLRDDVNTALSQLSQRKIISYEEVYLVRPHWKYNDGINTETINKLVQFYGDENIVSAMVNYYGATSKKPLEREPLNWFPDDREATTFEKSIILLTHNFTLEKMELESMRDVYRTGRANEFYKAVNDSLQKHAGIHHAYKSYSINFAKSILKESVEKIEELAKYTAEEKERLQLALNSGFSEGISKNAETYFNDIIALNLELQNKEEGFHFDYAKERNLTNKQNLILSSNNYTVNINRLIERFI